MLVTFSGLGKNFGDQALFEDANLQLAAGHRYGLVGANGSGKSTLLAMLAGSEPPSDGEIVIPKSAKLGVLVQDRYLSDQQRIRDVAMMGDEAAWKALAELAEATEREQADAAKIVALEERVQATDGYTLGARAGAVLEGLGIGSELHEEPLSVLSGGFKLRVLLAQTLVGAPDLLLLDEPTNHLDILTIRWLETFLGRYEGCAVVVSHDHRFLDNVATDILDVDYQTILCYPGNYSAFVAQKAKTREQKEQEIARQQKIIDQKKAFVERFRYKKTKARQAQSRLKQIEKIEIEELPATSRRAPLFRFEQTRKSGKDVLDVRGISKAYDDHRVLDDVSLTVRRGERVAIVGANGLGKSTLLKIAVGRLEPDAGEVSWGHETAVGYFAQNHHELLQDERETVLDHLWSICPQEGTSFVRGQLGRMLFSGSDVEKPTAALSGGEAARLIFSRIIVQQPNVLVLDEPTNHLDLESIEALVEALRAYEGTLLFVSHDRWFVSQLATRVVEITRAGLDDYPGGYDDFLARRGHDHLDPDAVVKLAREERTTEGDGHSDKLDWKEQKRRRAEHNKLVKERDDITARIEGHEARVKEIQQAFCADGFFTDTPPDEIKALEAEQAELEAQIEALMGRWEAVEGELEALGAVDG